jgi:hypothetical protein
LVRAIAATRDALDLRRMGSEVVSLKTGALFGGDRRTIGFQLPAMPLAAAAFGDAL